MLYQLTLVPEGRRLWISDQESIRQALLRQGYIPPVTCGEFDCQVCQIELFHGQVISTHTQHDNSVLACQALPLSDLVISWPGIQSPLDLTASRLTAKISTATQVATEIWRLLIEPITPLFTYRAGQYLLLGQTDMEAGSQAQAYSIANAPLGAHHVELHVRHHTDTPFTQSILDAAKTGADIYITGPFGKAIYQPQPEHPVVIVVGGTGFAQGKALLEAHLAQEPQKPAHLFWVARSAEELYLHELLTEWQTIYPAFHFTPIVSRPKSSRWHGHSERIYHVVTHYYPDLSQTQIYASGPQGLVLDALNTFMAHGMPREWMIADLLT